MPRIRHGFLLEAISKLVPMQKKMNVKRSQGNFSSHSGAYDEQKSTKNLLDRRFFCSVSSFEMASRYFLPSTIYLLIRKSVSNPWHPCSTLTSCYISTTTFPTVFPV